LFLYCSVPLTTLGELRVDACLSLLIRSLPRALYSAAASSRKRETREHGAHRGGWGNREQRKRI